MSKTIKIRKGLDIKLQGEADKVKTSVDFAGEYALKPSDFHGLTAKLHVKEGDKVKAGSVLFHDKYNEEIFYLSPVAGEVTEIVRGAKRRLLEIRIKSDAENSYEGVTAYDTNSDAEATKQYLLKNGLWPFIKMRPIDVVAKPSDTPKAIFISGFDSKPLAPDYDFILHGDDAHFQAGLDIIAKLTNGKVHLTLNGKTNADAALTGAKGVTINKIYGKHPAGNVGTQIHKIEPINKGEIVWTLNPQDVAIIGRVATTGQYDLSKVVAITGSEVKSPKYLKTIVGAKLTALLNGNVEEGNNRFISGNVLTGENVGADGYLGFYESQVTVIPEGDEPRFVATQGWFGPGLNKMSASKAYPSWLMPNKKYRLDTNTNGEERAFVVTGEMEKVFPFDIYPMQLVKSVMYNDIDLMEKLGIYEVAPEDFALCEFVCTSKVNIQDVVRGGLDVIQEECM
ncbi:MAG: Na(+)-translocating NADH-quinone reductase subunit A [Crocinitomicaceae bacterium]|nr:Na(+)-translocating NADH-quinone reductase subunit A [Crocinitomicaceae bacterium]